MQATEPSKVVHDNPDDRALPRRSYALSGDALHGPAPGVDDDPGSRRPVRATATGAHVFHACVSEAA